MKSAALVGLLACSTALAMSAPAGAQGWLKEMPSEQEVVAEIRGEDRLDTLARQSAAFHHLYSAAGRLLGEKQLDPTPAQERLLRNYETGRDGAQARAGTSTATQAAWLKLADGYFADEAFRAEVLRTFLSKRLRERIAATPEVDSTPDVVHAFPPPPKPEEDPKIPAHFIIAGIVLVLASGALMSRRRRYWDEW